MHRVSHSAALLRAYLYSCVHVDVVRCIAYVSKVESFIARSESLRVIALFVYITKVPLAIACSIRVIRLSRR